MVWDGTCTGLLLNIGSGKGNGVTAARYTDQVLHPHSQEHFAKHQNHIFLHNIVRIDTTRLTLDFLEQKHVSDDLDSFESRKISS